MIVGYNSSLDQYVVLQNSTRERFLRKENEGYKWEVNNPPTGQYNPSKSDIKIFIEKNSSRSDVKWYNPEEEIQTKTSSRGAAAVSSFEPREAATVSSFEPRGAAAVSSFAPRDAAVQELIELARTNIEFKNWISDLSRSGGVTSDLLFASDKFRSLLTDAARREMDRFLNEGGPSPDWMKVGQDAYRSGVGILENVKKIASGFGMNMFCYDCNKQVNLATKCPVTGRYHMG